MFDLEIKKGFCVSLGPHKSKYQDIVKLEAQECTGDNTGEC